MAASIANHLARNRMARVAGGLYIAFVLASILADLLGHIGRGMPQLVYGTILTEFWGHRTRGQILSFDIQGHLEL